ncbi:MAG: hypothetical protein ACREUZ_13095, partial [Burkholderiales bacterium]
MRFLEQQFFPLRAHAAGANPGRSLPCAVAIRDTAAIGTLEGRLRQSAGAKKQTTEIAATREAMVQDNVQRGDELGPDYAGLDPATASDLVAANRILAAHGVLDSFGHVSIRDPRDPTRYLQMQAIAPRDVSARDLITFDLDSNALNA